MWLGEIRYASHHFPYYHSCLDCADEKQILPALTQLVTLSLLLQRVDQARRWAGLRPGSAGSTSKTYSACACPGESTVQYFIWGFPQRDLIPLLWKGWRDERVLPTAPHGTTRCWCCFAGEICSQKMKSHRSSMEVPQPPALGQLYEWPTVQYPHLLHTLLGNKAVKVGPTTQGLHRAISLLQKQKSEESLI